MENNSIRVNDFLFEKGAGRSITFHGKHSGKPLAGIDLNTSVFKKDIEKVENLFTHEIVQVEDPFVNRSYQARLQKTSESYKQGAPFHHYSAEIREVDILPEFSVLDIDGNQFPVLKYSETDETNDAIGRHALLKLNDAQFKDLQNLFKRETIQIKRIGIDEKPISVCYGGAMLWSRHEESGSKYYKQIVRFMPPDMPVSKVHIAYAPTQDALSRMVVSLSARFEALLDDLVQNKFITPNRQSDLVNKDWRDLVREDRLDEIIRELERVPDAEEEL